MTVLPYPPYTLDLAQVDFFYFLNLKSPSKGQRFTIKNEMKKKLVTELRAIQKLLFRIAFNSRNVIGKKGINKAR
jgi:hypothetical protein